MVSSERLPYPQLHTNRLRGAVSLPSSVQKLPGREGIGEPPVMVGECCVSQSHALAGEVIGGENAKRDFAQKQPASKTMR